jgi:hypothetical protein
MKTVKSNVGRDLCQRVGRDFWGVGDWGKSFKMGGIEGELLISRHVFLASAIMQKDATNP